MDLAAWHRRRFSLVTVGITGSTGKTTTKEMVAAVLAQSFSVHKNRGNYNTEIGVPLTLFELEPDHEIAVLEMGMRGREQIRRLAQVAAPKIGVITNIGLTHLELLGTVENIARAKWELVEELPPAGVAVLNGDDERLRQLSRSFKGRVFSMAWGWKMISGRWRWKAARMAASVLPPAPRREKGGFNFPCRAGTMW